MNQKKADKTLALWVAVGILLFYRVGVSIAQTPPETPPLFSDIQGHWAQQCIQTLAQRQIVGGNREDNRFRPDEPMKRVELAVILSQAFPNVESVREPTNFADIPTTYWAYTAIRDADRKGFLSGYIARSFNPRVNVSRAQVLTALTQGLGYQPRLLSKPQLERIFSDANQIPEEAKNAIAAATENGLVVNHPNVKQLNPNRPATRAEVATFICQAITDTRETPFVSTEYIARIPASELSGSSPELVVLNAQDVEEKPEDIVEKVEENQPISTTPEASEPSEPSVAAVETISPSESLPLIPEIPESLEATARSEDVEALLFYQPQSESSTNQVLRLQIVRRGQLRLNEAILLIERRNNQPIDEFLGVKIADINGDKEPEVIIDFRTNRSNSQVYYSLIYRYNPIRGQYIPLRQDWGETPPERLQNRNNVPS